MLQQSHPELESHFQDVLVKQWHCHSQALLCATCATSPVPAQPLQPGQGMLGCSVPRFLHTPHPSCGSSVPATPATTSATSSCGRENFIWQLCTVWGRCLAPLRGSLVTHSTSCREMEPFNHTGAHLAPEMGPGWAMGMGKAFPEMGNDLLLLESHSRAWCPSLALPRPQRAGMGTVATLGLCLSPSHGNRVRNGQGRRSLLLCRLSYPDKHSQGSEGLCCRGGQCPGHPLGKQRGNEHLDSELSLLLLGAHTDKPGCILWDKPCVLLEPGMLLLPSQGHPTAPKGTLGTVLEPPRQRFERETKLLSNPSAEGAERWIKDLWVRAETIPA